MTIKNVSSCAVTVLTSVYYVQDLMQEVLIMDKTCTLYAPKFVGHVRKSALNTHLTMQVAKNVLMLVKNAQKFAKNLLPLEHNISCAYAILLLIRMKKRFYIPMQMKWNLAAQG